MQTLTSTEESIMNCIWDFGQDISVADLLTCMKERFNKDYARTTVCVFMSYLREKGFVAYNKKSHAYVYHPLVTREDYRKSRVEELMNRCFEGSSMELIRTAFTICPPSKEELAQLAAELEQLTE